MHCNIHSDFPLNIAHLWFLDDLYPNCFGDPRGFLLKHHKALIIFFYGHRHGHLETQLSFLLYSFEVCLNFTAWGTSVVDAV